MGPAFIHTVYNHIVLCAADEIVLWKTNPKFEALSLRWNFLCSTFQSSITPRYWISKHISISTVKSHFISVDKCRITDHHYRFGIRKGKGFMIVYDPFCTFHFSVKRTATALTHPFFSHHTTR